MRNKMKKILLVVLISTFIISGFSHTFSAAPRDTTPPACNKVHVKSVVPSERLEGYMTFVAYVENDAGDPVGGAKVYVETEDESDSIPFRYTEIDGHALWDNIYKVVDQTTEYIVWAEKDNYCTGETLTFTVTNRELYFVEGSLPPNREMPEQTLHTIQVIDHYGEPFQGAWVYFPGFQGWTNGNGEKSIWAWDVTAENVLEDPFVPVSLEACYTHYKKAQVIIKVEDLDNIPSTLKCHVYDNDLDPITGPIEGATVKVINTGDQNITNETGKCEFIVFPDTWWGYTKYALRAKAPGFIPKTVKHKVYPGYPKNYWFPLVKIWWPGPVVVVEITTTTYDAELGIDTVEFEATPEFAAPELYDYQWDFGDGTHEPTDLATATHNYRPGSYIIRVTAIKEGTSEIEYGELHLEIY